MSKFYVYSKNIHTGEKTYITGWYGENIEYTIDQVLEQISVLRSYPSKNVVWSYEKIK